MRLTIERKASDLHLTVGLPPVLRLSGKLVHTEFPRLMPDDTKRLVYSILNDKQREKFEKTWELDCSHGVRGFGRFRVNVFRQRGYVGATLRSISGSIPNRTDLNLPEIVEEVVSRPTRAVHIITIEDPIEYVHPHKKAMINQREIGHDTQSWTNALKGTLREDPDVILIGEMRDFETVAGALTAAETGHLVFGTLHTSDASQTIDRIIDIFPPHQQQQTRVQLAGVLEAVFCQQLVPHSSGIGRVPAIEILLATPAVKSLIREGKSHQIYNTIQTGSKYGMKTMEQSLLELCVSKQILEEEALARTTHQEELKRMIDSAMAASRGRGASMMKR